MFPMEGPKGIPEFAKICLEALASQGMGEKISIGEGSVFWFGNWLRKESLHALPDR